LITIVSGLPRSGTSLMMQILAAGGMTILTDNKREPDADNPRGYCEWEPAKLLPTQPERIDEAEGKAVKVITQLLMSIPRGRDYRVIFMERPLPEVLASQDEMLRRRGKSDVISHDVMGKAFASHIKEIVSWFENRSEIPVLRLGYPRLLQDPRANAQAVEDFLKVDLDLDAMARQVDASLYRNRCS
jgi:LPS sulfotransferase NodH